MTRTALIARRSRSHTGSASRRGHRVGDRETALVDGATHYDPGQTPAASLQPGQPAEVVQRPDTPRCDQRHLALLEQSAVPDRGRGRA